MHPELVEGRGMKEGLELSEWFDWLTMHGAYSAHPEPVEGWNGLNDLNEKPT
jgi:hypothetical protein